MQEDFDQAAADVNKLTSQPSQDELLKLYALFKQATVGDVNTGPLKRARTRSPISHGRGLAVAADRPGMFDLKGKYKWDAWNALKGAILPLTRFAVPTV